MSAAALSAIYGEYIACLNRRTLAELPRFVCDDVRYNDKPIGLSGYVDMLRGNYADIPDLAFNVELVVENAPLLACRLLFDCHPKSAFMGASVNGRRVRFHENVMYEFADGKIAKVWSVIDKAAIEAQLAQQDER